MRAVETAGVATVATDIPIPYRVVECIRETHDVVTLRVRPMAEPLPSFSPAQFSMIGVTGVGEVPISISSEVDDDSAHAFTIRRAGAVTAALCDRRPGDAVTIRGPFGRGWDLERTRGRHAIFVAGGIGIAPLRAAIDHTVSHAPHTNTTVSVLAGAKDPGDLVFGSWLDAIAGEGVHVGLTVDAVGASEATWHNRIGLVTELIAEAVVRGGVPVDDVVAYVCGPDPMMTATVQAFDRIGVPPGQVQLTLERNMQCGNGWCGHCQLGPVLLCRDGPVVDAADLGNLLERSEL